MALPVSINLDEDDFNPLSDFEEEELMKVKVEPSPPIEFEEWEKEFWRREYATFIGEGDDI